MNEPLITQKEWNAKLRELRVANERIAELEAKLAEQSAGQEPCAWGVWIEVADMPGWDSVWERPEFANDHLNETLQNDWGEPIKTSGVVAMTLAKDDHYPIPEWLRKHIQERLRTRGQRT